MTEYKEVIENLETTERNESRKSIPVEISRKATNIVNEIQMKNVALALLVLKKKDFAIHYLIKGMLHEDGPSAKQVVSAIYNGQVYDPTDKSFTIEMPAQPNMITEIAERVQNDVVETKETKSKLKAIEIAKELIEEETSNKLIMKITGLTEEEISNLRGQDENRSNIQTN